MALLFVVRNAALNLKMIRLVYHRRMKVNVRIEGPAPHYYEGDIIRFVIGDIKSEYLIVPADECEFFIEFSDKSFPVKWHNKKAPPKQGLELDQ